MDKRQRPALHVWLNPLANALVVTSELNLRYSEVRIDHTVRMGDPDHLAAKTVLAAGDPSMRLAIGKHGRARVEAHALSRVVQDYLGVLAVAVAQHRPSPEPLFAGE